MLTFVASLQQYHHWARLPEFGGTAVASGDFEATWEAEQAGRKVVDLWTYHTAEDAESLDEAAWSYCEAVADAYAGRVMQGDCDLVAHTKYDLYYSIRFALHSSVMIARCMDEVKPDRVACFAEMAQSFFWDPTETPPDIFNAVVAWEAERRGLPLRLLSLPFCQSEPKRSLHGFKQISSNGGGRVLKGNPDYIAIAPGYDYREQELLLADAEERGEEQWLLISDPDVASGSELPQISHNALLSLPYDTQLAEEAIREIRSCGLPHVQSLPKSIGDVLANPRLAFVWDFYCDALEAGSRAYCAGQAIVRAYKPRLILHGYDAWGSARCFISGVKAEGGRIVANQHAGFGYLSGLRRSTGLDASAWCWGKYDANELQRWRASGSPVNAVGSLRRDCAWLLSEPEEKVSGAKSSEQLARPKIVFLTARIAHISAPTANMATHKVAWRELLSSCARFPNWDFVIKAHPRYDYRRMYESWAGPEAGRINLVVSVDPAREVLQGASAAILVDVPSTVAAEACALRVPVFSFTKAVYSKQISVLDMGGIPVITDAQFLFERIETLIRESAEREAQLVQQERFLREALVATGSEAVALARADMQRQAADASDRSAHDEALRRIFDMIHSAETSLRGALPRADSRRLLKGLSQTNRINGGPVPSLVRAGLISDYLSSLPGRWGFWSRNGVSRARVAGWIRAALPPGLRPGRPRARAIMSQCLHQDAGIRYEDGRRFSAHWLELCSMLLAPGRLKKKVGIGH